MNSKTTQRNAGEYGRMRNEESPPYSPSPEPLSPVQHQPQSDFSLQSMGARQPVTQVVINQPTSNEREQLRPWSSNKCDCCEDCHSCLCVLFFGSCFTSCLATRMGENSCTPCCVPGGVIAMRSVLRSKNNIQGSICNDCCDLIFCGPCSLCQMSREMDRLGLPNKGCC